MIGIIRSLMRGLVMALACLVVGGCAGPGVYRVEPAASHSRPGSDSESSRCIRLFATVDSAVDDAGVRDARAHRVAGFPYLRSDRPLALLVLQAGDPEAIRKWVGLAAALDEQSRQHEVAHLPDHALIVDLGAPREALLDALRACREHLVAADLADPASVASLQRKAQVPSEYRAGLRVLGLYPLTRVLFADGIADWQARTLAVFEMPIEALPIEGRRVMYAPAAAPETNRAVQLRNADDEDSWQLAQRAGELARLVALHAPVFSVDEVGEDDRIGTLAYAADGDLFVDTAKPVVYWRLGHAYLGGRWLPQIIYTAWFPARTTEPGLDLLGGRYDGLTWRVTLGADGEPLVYDTIHPCGCYHLFFPTAAVKARIQPQSLDEGMFAPQTLARVSAGQVLVLHLEAGTHYLQRVSPGGAVSEPIDYALIGDDSLRSLPLPGPTPVGALRRSAFGPDGIIPGSERAERFLFWPMGVPNAGAMRQWGRHATAFVGERHFDDPGLLERYFELR